MIMRIRINRPSKLLEFNLIEYAKFWVDKQLELRVDDELGKREEKDKRFEHRENSISTKVQYFKCLHDQI
jgi:hypothetical protein